MSSYNMPPGVTTNDIPGNGPDSEPKAEYIVQFGENGAETIVQGWLDDCPLSRETKRDELLPALLRALVSTNLSELELAEWASKCMGGPTYEEWLDSL